MNDRLFVDHRDIHIHICITRISSTDFANIRMKLKDRCLKFHDQMDDVQMVDNRMDDDQPTVSCDSAAMNPSLVQIRKKIEDWNRRNAFAMTGNKSSSGSEVSSSHKADVVMTETLVPSMVVEKYRSVSPLERIKKLGLQEKQSLSSGIHLEWE